MRAVRALLSVFLSFFLPFFLSFLLAFSTPSHPPGPLSPPSFAVLLQSSRCWLVVGCGWLSLFPPSFPPPACVCVKHLNRRKTSSNTCFHCGGGNLMFAADCPTKRAVFMTDITLGRRSHVPSISTSFSCRFPFTVNGNRPSQEPASRSLFHARLPQTSIWPYLFLSELGDAWSQPGLYFLIWGFVDKFRFVIWIFGTSS